MNRKKGKDEALSVPDLTIAEKPIFSASQTMLILKRICKGLKRRTYKQRFELLANRIERLLFSKELMFQAEEKLKETFYEYDQRCFKMWKHHPLVKRLYPVLEELWQYLDYMHGFTDVLIFPFKADKLIKEYA